MPTMTPSRPTPRFSIALAALALAAVMLVVPANASLCASALGFCAMPTAPAPVDAHCSLAAAQGADRGAERGAHRGGATDTDCCVADAAPQGPPPAVPGQADAERQIQPLPTLAPATPAPVLPAVAALAPRTPPPAADLAASAVPLYTLFSTLLS